MPGDWRAPRSKIKNGFGARFLRALFPGEQRPVARGAIPYIVSHASWRRPDCRPRQAGMKKGLRAGPISQANAIPHHAAWPTGGPARSTGSSSLPMPVAQSDSSEWPSVTGRLPLNSYRSATDQLQQPPNADGRPVFEHPAAPAALEALQAQGG